VAPVVQRVEIAHREALVKPGIHPRQAARDLTRDKRFLPPRTLVVKKHPVAGINPVALAVVHRDPVGIELCHAVGAARIERRSLLLQDFLHQAVELTGALLVDPRLSVSPTIRTASRIRSVPSASLLAVYSGLSKLTATWL